MPFRLLMMTPEARVLDEDVDGLVLPGADGFLGVLSHHAPMIAVLAPGVLTATHAGKATQYVVGDGGVEVGDNRVLIVTDMAVKAADPGDAETRLDEYLKDRDRPPLASSGLVDG